MRVNIAKRVRSLRKAAGLGSRELDRLAGLSEGHTSMIESRSREQLEIETASKIARIFGVSLDYLIAGVGEPPAEKALRAAVKASLRTIGT